MMNVCGTDLNQTCSLESRRIRVAKLQFYCRPMSIKNISCFKLLTFRVAYHVTMWQGKMELNKEGREEGGKEGKEKGKDAPQRWGYIKGTHKDGGISKPTDNVPNG